MDSQVKPVIIDLGAGPTKYPGSFGFDFCRRAGVDLICNFEQSLPLRSDSVDKVYSSHVMEHIRDFVGLMEEVYRICKPGATVLISVPYYTSRGAFTDPTHVRFFTENTFQLFEFPTYGIRTNFRVVTTEFHTVRTFRIFPKRVQKWFRRYLWNVVDGITVTLQAVK